MTDAMALREYVGANASVAANGRKAAGGANTAGIAAAFSTRLAAQVTASSLSGQAGNATSDPPRIVAGTSGRLPAAGTVLPPNAAGDSAPAAIAPLSAALAKPLDPAPHVTDNGSALARPTRPGAIATPSMADKRLPNGPTPPGSAAATRHGGRSHDPDAADASASVDTRAAAIPVPATPAPLFTVPEPVALTGQTGTTATTVPMTGGAGDSAVVPAMAAIGAAGIAAAAASFAPVAAHSGTIPARNRQITVDRAPPTAALDGAAAIATGIGTGTVSTAAHSAVATPAPTRAADFATLVDRLIDARTVANRGDAPQLVAAAVTHGEFGKVSLHFRPDIAGLSIAMSSADPGFAPAATAAMASLSAPAALLRSAEAVQARAAADAPAPPATGAAGTPTENPSGNPAAMSSHSQSRPHAPTASLRTARAGVGPATETKTASAPIAGIFA